MRRARMGVAHIIISLVVVSMIGVSCGDGGDGNSNNKQSEDWQQKIAFDLSDIGSNGLTGSPDGLVSVSYEFCIPKDREMLDGVLAIDPNIQCTSGPPGRVGCTKTEYLCLGNTHDPRWRDILQRIAQLDYVSRIERSVWE